MDHDLFSHPAFVHCIGDAIHAQVEVTQDIYRLDHVWITINIGLDSPALISVNTLSKRNRDAGFDSRIHMAVIQDQWKILPTQLFEQCPGFDYAEWERTSDAAYHYYDRVEMEKSMLDRCATAQFLEVWGMTYRRGGQGIHQVHCRWKSCAVLDDIRGFDGALRFYYPDGKRELILLKFCGQ